MKILLLSFLLGLSATAHAAKIEINGNADEPKPPETAVTTTIVACEVENRIGQVFQCQQICRHGSTPTCTVRFPNNAFAYVPAPTATGRAPSPMKTDAAMAAQMRSGAAAMRKH